MTEFADLPEAARLAAETFVEIYRDLERRRVAPAAPAAAVRRLFEGSLAGDDGVGLVGAVEDFRRDVLPNSMGTPHPLYAGLVNSSPLPGAALADLLISALNNNGGAFHQSPAMTACEEEVVRAFARLFGLPPERADGMVLPGGQFANLQAVVVARTHAFPDAPPAAARLYVSDAGHFSVARAARVAGLSRDAVVAIPTTGRGAMDPAALREKIRADRAAGAFPFAVVATLGTTGTGAIDPLGPIADVCAETQVWLHVDACYGGAAMLVPALRERIGPVGRADSIAVDPHKWFFVPVTAALLLVRDRAASRAAFADAASYIPGGGDDAWRRGIPCTRRSSGFAIWMALRAHGWRTIREAVERDIALCRLLETRLAANGYDVLPAGELSIAVARRPVPGLDPAQSDAFQQAIANHVAASGRAWFSTVRHAGATWLRFNFVNLHTREEHIERLVEILDDAVALEERNVRLRAQSASPPA